MKLTRGPKLALAVAAIFILGLSVNSLTAPSGLVAGPAAPSIFQPYQAELTATKSSNDVAVAKTDSISASLGFRSTTLSSTASQSVSSFPAIRMEIFSASMSVEVKDVKIARTQVASLAEQLGGFVGGSSVSVFGDSEVATIIIKVPRENFFEALNTIESLGKLKDLQTRSDDVTEEYIDLKARRDNLQKQEQRLVEILKLGNTVPDVLMVERELERVRAEIERLTGRINFIERNVEMSSIMVTLTKPGFEKAPEIDWTEPFRTGLGFFYGVVRGLVITGFVVAPFAVIGTPAYLAYRFRRSKNSKPETSSSSN